MVTFRPPNNTVLDAFLEHQRRFGFSYSQVGATRKAKRLSGHFWDVTEVGLGFGLAVFQRACRGLEDWVMHSTPILTVYPRTVPLESDRVLALIVRLGLVSMVSACKIAYTIHEPRRFGFAYGTLRDHPARGEEQFLIEWHDDDSVGLSLLAFSRPSSLVFWLGLPLTRLMQRVLTRSYIRNMQREVLL